MRAYWTFSSLLALAVCGLASRPAHAQSTCSTDSECVKGWTCQVSGGSTCASAPCPPGEKCEPSKCANVEIKSCQPGACQADSDCADGMLCYTHTESNCPPSACAAGQECPAAQCEPKTESACVPRYVLPCTTASDCGAGFQCESSGEQCTCSGSAPAGDGASDGGAPAPTPEPACTCEASKDLRCHATSVACDRDSDCTVGWSCAVVRPASDCATAPAPSPNPESSDSGAPGDGTPPPDCRSTADVKQCVPPYYALIEGVRGVSRDSSGSPTIGTGDSSSGNAADVPPTAESSKDDDGTASAGCSLAPGSRAGSALAVLGALGLFGALRRRRAR